MRYKRFVLYVLAAVVISGCASSQFGWNGQEQAQDQDVKMNEAFDPLTLDDDDISVEQTESNAEQAARNTGQQTEAEPNRPVPGEPGGESETVQGFRVQLLATSDEIMAREEKRRAVFKFQDAVYLIFEAPMYKIRVGDCVSRKEAESLKKLAVRQGFDDAWIVPSRITQR